MSSRRLDVVRMLPLVGLSGVVVLASACLPPPSTRARARVGGARIEARGTDLWSALLGVGVEAETATAARARRTPTAATVRVTPAARAPIAAAAGTAPPVASGGAAATAGGGAEVEVAGGAAAGVVVSGGAAARAGVTTAPGAAGIATPSDLAAGSAFAAPELESSGSLGAASGADLRTAAGLTVGIDADIATARRRVGRGTRLADLLEGGWVVDGVRVGLGDLVSLDGSAGALDTTGIGGARVGASMAGRSALDAGGLFRGSGSVEAWVDLEHAELPTTGGETRLVVRVVGRSASAPRGRLRVHLVIDRSSSMDGAWHHVLAAARQLVSRLTATDVLQVVVYADGAEEVWGPAPVGDGREALARLENVTVGGGTNIGAGLQLAYRSLARVPDMPGDRSLVFLVSDGRPNIGAFGPDDFARLSVDARARGCTTTVFGVGDGFDGDVLRAIARAGRGSYYVARTAAELTQPLVNELSVQERVAGLDVRVRIRMPGAVQVRGIEGTDVEREANTIVASFPVLRVGEERRIVLSLGVRASVEPRDLAAVDVSYRGRPGASVVGASRRVRVGFAAERRLAGASVGVALLDHDLARALDEAGTAVRTGDGQRAVRVLAQHVALVRARPDLARLPAVRARTESVARLATGITAMLPSAREPDRRLVGLALGGVAVRLGR